MSFACLARRPALQLHSLPRASYPDDLPSCIGVLGLVVVEGCVFVKEENFFLRHFDHLGMRWWIAASDQAVVTDAHSQALYHMLERLA